MGIKLKPLDQQTLVITGASSGIGLATARAAAKQGARVVLAARSEPALQDLVRGIEADGGRAVYVVADVGDRAQVQAIADRALERFGGFDTWVNDAGASIYGRIAEVSDEDNRRLFDTNFWGLVYGSQIAARHLSERGGALVNLGSVASDVGLPLQGMYSASKHAIKGFTDALRLELEEQEAPVSVTLIKPTSIASPFAQHAKNYTGREPTLPPPLYQPEDVAGAILHAATHVVRDIYVGSGSRIMSSFNQTFPSAIDWISRKTMSELEMRDESAHGRRDALQQPGEDGHVHGDFPDRRPRRSVYTQMSVHPALTGMLAALASVATLAAIRGTHHRH